MCDEKLHALYCFDESARARAREREREEGGGTEQLSFLARVYPLQHTAQGIVDAIKPDILKFHAMSQGNIEAIGLLFSEMARTPLPPQVSS